MSQATAQTLEPPFPGVATGFGPGEFFDRAVGALTRVDPRELEQYRAQFTRYACWLLGNAEAAEDAVQDTLLAALHAAPRFAGRSSVRAWLFGILKHKVMDLLRRRAFELPADESDADRLADPCTRFTENGQWRSPPSSFGDPETALDQKRFLDAMHRCIDRLPKNTARVFTMREILGMETTEICAVLGITPGNCLVILHRARMALRQWLERDWAGETRGAASRA
jgi:RNA polymerase sigma-70 factor (ECF subfamily)